MTFSRKSSSDFFTRVGQLLLVGALIFTGSKVNAEQKSGSSPSGPLQAFMLTTTYGVIAGTLTGLASLAFYEEPSTKTKNIAVGASLGLYVGIIMGAWIVYSPSMDSDPKKNEPGKKKSGYDDDPIDLGVKQKLGPELVAQGSSGYLAPSMQVPQMQPLLWVDPIQGSTHLGVKFNF